jgi:hypothetical protein
MMPITDLNVCPETVFCSPGFGSVPSLTAYTGTLYKMKSVFGAYVSYSRLAG